MRAQRPSSSRTSAAASATHRSQRRGRDALRPGDRSRRATPLAGRPTSCAAGVGTAARRSGGASGIAASA
jgi:hypothetical protein